MVTEILKDLNRLDYLDSVNVVNLDIIFKLQEAHRVRDSVDVKSLYIITNQVYQIQLSQKKAEVLEKKSDIWQKRYKRQKGQKWLLGGIGITLLIALFVVS